MDDSSVKALSDKTIYRIVGEALERAELLMRKKGMSNDAETFAQASTHWLRHTFGRHAVAGGVQANIVQAVLGHASLATTTRCTSAKIDEAARQAIAAMPSQQVRRSSAAGQLLMIGCALARFATSSERVCALCFHAG